jgi:hypothetical protein
MQMDPVGTHYHYAAQIKRPGEYAPSRIVPELDLFLFRCVTPHKNVCECTF